MQRSLMYMKNRNDKFGRDEHEGISKVDVVEHRILLIGLINSGYPHASIIGLIESNRRDLWKIISRYAR